MNFDRLAPFYQAMEALAAGRKLHRCRIEFLGEVPVPLTILLAGEGHGRFLPECLCRFPEAHIVVIDSSRRMLEIAKSRVDPTRVEFIHADLLEWCGPSAPFDLVVTHFFLDCFTADELPVVIGKLARMAAPGADWLLADFEIAPAGAARWRCRFIVGMLYRFFGIVTGLRATSLIRPDGEIQESGFIRHRRVTYDWGLLKSEWWQRGG